VLSAGGGVVTVRVGRGHTAAVAGGQPIQAHPLSAIRVPCDDCEARAGQRCHTFRIVGGVRTSVRGVRVKFHDARKAALRASLGGDQGRARG
jgi:hypothetical protein